MKVLVIEPAGKGGMIHYAWQLCQAMQEEGAEVTLLTDQHYELESLEHSFTLRRDLRLWDPKPQSETSSGFGKRVRRIFRAFVYYREWLRIISIARGLRPDVIQLGDIRFATDLFPIRLLRGIAPVMADICHNVHPFSGGTASTGTFELARPEHALYRRIYREFDTIFVHYRVNAAEFERTFPGSSDEVVPIVHGNEEIFRKLSDRDVSPTSLRNKLEIEDSRQVILFFGTLSLYKGLDLLLDAFEIVADRVQDAVLILAGYPMSPFDPAGYLADAERRGLGDRVRIVGEYIPSAEVVAWMELADITVFPYRAIYQSGALHLAQTFGATIVATRVGAMPEVIRHEESGLLVEPGDPEALAFAIVRFLRDPSLAAQTGAAAREDALDRFSWSGVARGILDTYERLLERTK